MCLTSRRFWTMALAACSLALMIFATPAEARVFGNFFGGSGGSSYANDCPNGNCEISDSASYGWRSYESFAPSRYPMATAQPVFISPQPARRLVDRSTNYVISSVSPSYNATSYSTNSYGSVVSVPVTLAPGETLVPGTVTEGVPVAASVTTAAATTSTASTSATDEKLDRLLELAESNSEKIDKLVRQLTFRETQSQSKPAPAYLDYDGTPSTKLGLTRMETARLAALTRVQPRETLASK